MELKTPTTLTTTTAPTTTTTTTTTTTPETETETPPTKHLSKGLSFTNGAFKLLHQNSTPPPPPQAVVVYKECLKNHAATLGGHALDGCGEFMPSPTATPTDPTSLKCAACGCHRNFHRRDPEEQGTHMIEYHPQLPTQIPTHRVRSPNSVSPPPISSSYYPSAPQMLLALSTGGLSVKPENHHNSGTAISPMGGITNGSGRKRFRTKFSQEQKDKMYSFSERLGWKMQKRDEGLVEEFCNEVGVGKGVLKVWMHNNKHTFGKREVNGTSGSGGGGGGGSGGVVTTPTNLHSNTIITTPNNNNNNNTTTLGSNIINTLSSNNNNSHSHHNHGNSAHVGTNCSSSSS